MKSIRILLSKKVSVDKKSMETRRIRVLLVNLVMYVLLVKLFCRPPFGLNADFTSNMRITSKSSKTRKLLVSYAGAQRKQRENIIILFCTHTNMILGLQLIML